MKTTVSARRPRTHTAFVAATLGVLPILAGCMGVVDRDGAAPQASGQAGSGGVSKPPNQAENCEGWDVAMPRRIVRLSFNQVAASLEPLFGAAFAAEMVAKNSIKDPTERTFPPLGDTDEGSSYIDSKWQTADAIAKAASEKALSDFPTSSGCGAAPSRDCAQTFVLALAERAFRRPLTDAMRASLVMVLDDALMHGAPVAEGVQYAVWAVFDSPHFLYRTELGEAPGQEGPLTPYELASQLSYFLTDGPPDAQLLDAAAQNRLSSPELITPHVDRLLATPAARLNLQAAVIASLGLSKVLSVVIDPMKVPEFNGGVAASMFHESELFVRDVLWNGGKVPELVTSRKGFVNAKLAALYGVPTPTVLDADGFGSVELAPERAGILTSLAFLTSRSRPDAQSVVGRGLSVNDTILCQQNPAFPEALADQIKQLTSAQESLSERERADYRAATSPCKGCHTSFDPFGVSLENFDVIGRYRTNDDQQRPIDASVTLPSTAGGATAMSAAEMGQALASSGAFAACAATKLLTYALAETGVKGTSCATKAVADRFAKTDASFVALVREVATSKTLTHRAGG